MHQVVPLLGLLAFAEPSLGGRFAVELAAAEAHARALEFEEALAALDRAFGSGDGRPNEVARAHAFVGQVAAAMGLEERARLAFRRALLLDPGFELDAGASPKLAAPFAAARTAVGSERLTVAVTATFNPPASLRVRVRWPEPHAGLVTGGRIYLRGGVGFRRVALVAGDDLRADERCEAAATCAFYIALTDERGNEVIWAGSPDAPLFPRAAAPAVSVQEAPPPASTVEPLHRRPWPYLATAAGLGLVAGYFGTRFTAQQKELSGINVDRANHTRAEAQALDDDRRQSFGAMIGTGAGAALAAAVGFFVW